MASSSLKVGGAFLLSTPPKGSHLFVAIALTPEGSYLCVSITTERTGSDPACILSPGAGMHSFLIRRSAMSYKYAREIDVATYSKLIEDRDCVPSGRFSQAILEQIQQG